jgi:DprA winged helix domain
MKDVRLDKKAIAQNKEAANRIWKQFIVEFPTEEDCLREIFKRIGDGIKCQFCASTNWYREDGERYVRCLDCHKKSWPTAGTFFHRARKLQARLGAIYLMDHGVIFNAATLADIADITYDCAWNIICRLMKVINDNFADDSLSAPSALFESVIAKRSRETPALMHPFSEQAVAESKMPPSQEEEAQRQDVLDDLPPNQRTLYAEITDQPIHFDVLEERIKMDISELNVSLVMLELAGLISQLHGQWYKRNKPKATEAFNLVDGQAVGNELQERKSSLLSAAINFFGPLFYGISRKYLQLYLARFWHSIDKKRWWKGALLEACLRFRYISKTEIRSYVSPLLVNLSPA